MHACTHTWGLTIPYLGLQTPVVPLLLVSPYFGVLTEEGVQGAESGPWTRVPPLTWPDSDLPTSAGMRVPLKSSYVVPKDPIPHSRL